MDTLILQDWQHYIGLEPARPRIATVMQAIHRTPHVHDTTPCDREREEMSRLRSRRRERWGQSTHQRRLTRRSRWSFRCGSGKREVHDVLKGNILNCLHAPHYTMWLGMGRSDSEREGGSRLRSRRERRGQPTYQRRLTRQSLWSFVEGSETEDL
jgi:hypothetical protein